jgi:hypothetical protein
VVLAVGAAVFLFVHVAESTVPTVWVLHDDDPVRPPSEDRGWSCWPARVVNAHLVSQKSAATGGCESSGVSGIDEEWL